MNFDNKIQIFALKLCGSGISVGPWPWGQLQLFESERSLLFPPFFLLFFSFVLFFLFSVPLSNDCANAAKKNLKKSGTMLKNHFSPLLFHVFLFHFTKLYGKPLEFFKVSNIYQPCNDVFAYYSNDRENF